MTFLRMAYTDRFGTLHPNAVIEIRDVRLELSANHAEVALNVYASQEALDAGADPLEERPPRALSVAEIGVLRDQFGLATYRLLQLRDEFKTAELVP